jgi:acyl-CoA thioester hydrolase
VIIAKAAGVCGQIAVRVYYEDTDFSGFVYHASYLRFMERGRTELLRSAGISQSLLQNNPTQNLVFVVRRMTIDFVKPAGMDDLLQVETGVDAVGAASVELSQRVCRRADLLVRAHITIACVASGRPVRLSADLRRKLCPKG